MQDVYGKKNDMDTLLKDRGADLNVAFKQGEERVKSTLSDMEHKITQGKEQIKTVIADVDKKLHDNPWPIVAGVAVGCVLLGFIMGINKKQS